MQDSSSFGTLSVSVEHDENSQTYQSYQPNSDMNRPN
jgi:hypothetical protein